MSIKIYDAYRFPTYRLNEATRIIHEAMTVKVQERFNELAEALMKDMPTLNPYRAGCKIMELATKAAESPYRSGADLECGFRFWICDVGALVYLQFWGSDRLFPVQLPDWMQEYHYQNSTDRPDEIPVEDWHDRLVNWERVCLNRESVGRFVHTVMDRESFFDLVHRFMEKHPKQEWMNAVKC